MLNLKAAPVPGIANWRFLIQYMPISLAVRELMRLRALYELGTIEKPILDVGCGDGLFWEHLVQAIRQREVSDLTGLLGIDISASELNMASVRIKAQGGQVLNHDISTPIAGGEIADFRFVMANCSLEHVAHIEPALRNIHSLMQDEGRFVLFVPAPQWTETLALKKFFSRISPRLGGLVGGCLDGFFQHRHLYPAEVWRFLLKGIGFEVEQIRGLGSPAANSVFERGLPMAFLAFIWKILFSKYPFWFKNRSAHLTTGIQEFLTQVQQGQILRTHLIDPDIVEYFIVCRKK